MSCNWRPQSKNNQSFNKQLSESEEDKNRQYTIHENKLLTIQNDNKLHMIYENF